MTALTVKRNAEANKRQATKLTKNKEKYKNKSPNQDKARGNTGRIVKDTRAGNTRSKHQEQNTLPDNEGGKTTDDADEQIKNTGVRWKKDTDRKWKVTVIPLM